MTRFALKICYVGTRYHGWQVQDNAVTVQKVMCDTISNMLKQEVAVTGCSRTDAGVHANEFVCHFDAPDKIPENAFVNGLNSVLPEDIAVISCIKVNSDFHARYSAKGKNYIYKFFDAENRNPFLANLAYHVTRRLDENLMNEFCERMIGKYDFSGFSSIKRTVTDTVRTISECRVERNKDIITLSVTADGFLYNMVRIIAGTALDVSYGKIDPSDTQEIILSKDRRRAGITAPAHGLYLNHVIY